MARYRLKSAHYIEGDKWLPGDKEMSNLGDDRGTIVGDGTEHKITTPTLEMVPLDTEAEAALAIEETRLAVSGAAMNPVEQLAMSMGAVFDDYERRFVPGFNARRAVEGA